VLKEIPWQCEREERYTAEGEVGDIEHEVSDSRPFGPSR